MSQNDQSQKRVSLAIFRYVIWMTVCGLVGACFTILIFYSDLNSKLIEECWSVALAQKVNCDNFKLLRAFSGMVPGLFVGFLIAKKSGRP